MESAFVCGSGRLSSFNRNHSASKFVSPQKYNAPLSKRHIVRSTLNIQVPTSEDTPSSSWTGAEELSKSTLVWPTVLDIEGIRRVLPHRYPFLLVDRVVAFEPGKRAIAIKNVSMNEQFFNGHFPERPIMPGVLQVEALAQVAGIVMLQPPISDGKGDFFFGGVDGVRWRKPVVPGDTLVMEAELKSFKKKFGIAKMSGRAFVDGKLVVEAELTLAMAKGE